MSPAYVYNQIKIPGGGAYFLDAFNLLLDQGVSSWAQMPYDPSDDRTQPSAAARAEAANYRIADWGTVLRTTHAVFVQEIKRHLASGDPVVIGVPVYPDFVSLSESNPIYDDGGGSYGGAHAVVIVGYDDTRSAFKIVNSWGADWGIGGYGWIDYDASKSVIWEAYVTGDVVASPDDKRPDAASDPRPGTAATGVAVDTALSWTRNARTTSFDVYLGVGPDLHAVDFQGNVARPTFSADFAPGSQYYWRVDARGSGGVTRGPVWSFTTAGTLDLPGKAVNPRPLDGETAVARETVLSWDSGGHTTSYDVYFGTRSVPGAREFQGTQATRTLSPGRLLAGTRYYWRIDAKNGQGTTPGAVWSFTTESSTPVSGTVWRGVASGIYAGLNAVTWSGERFVTVGGRAYVPGEPGFIWHSSDGTTWHVADSGTQELLDNIIGEGQWLGDVASNGERFVAVGSDEIVYSEDGGTWTAATPDGIGRSVQAVAWDGERFVAVGGPMFLHSGDGITWTARGRDDLGKALYDLVWNGERFVAVGQDRTIVHSTDGIRWRFVSSRRLGVHLLGITWNGERFVAVGSYGTILYSSDGITWTTASSGTTASLQAVTWNGELFVAVGRWVSGDRTTEILYSSDGIAWAAAQWSGTSGLRGGISGLHGVAWNGERFVAVGHAGTILTSP